MKWGISFHYYLITNQRTNSNTRVLTTSSRKWTNGAAAHGQPMVRDISFTGNKKWLLENVNFWTFTVSPSIASNKVADSAA